MNEYPKINTIYKRNPEDKFKSLLVGEFSQPEFEYLQNNEWQFTEKIDGTNIRIIYDNDEITFKGKTDNAQIQKFLLKKLETTFLEKINLFKEIFPDSSVCLYGEGYGLKIQKDGGNYISNGVDFILFDIKINNFWLKREDLEDITNKLELKIVPVVGTGTLNDMFEIVNKGFKSLVAENKDYIAEGIVAKPIIELKDRGGHRIITKLKHKDFKGVKYE